MAAAWQGQLEPEEGEEGLELGGPPAAPAGLGLMQVSEGARGASARGSGAPAGMGDWCIRGSDK